MRNFLILICLFFYAFCAHADDRIDDVYFSAKPIKMIVSTKKDSLIYFSNPVRVKDDFANHLDIMVTNDVVIVRAKILFEAVRVVFQDLVTKQVYIFSISSGNGANPRSIRVIVPGEQESEDVATSEGGAYISLTQHASMTLYYPDRYTPKTRGVREVELKKGDASYFISFNAKAEAIRSWKGFGLFVTAIKITNQENKIINIDPRRHFRGDWLFLTPQHGWMGNDSSNNITTIYVISERPFWEALL